jgi:hypothetical protein
MRSKPRTAELGDSAGQPGVLDLLQPAEASEAQGDQLVIERVDLAHRRDVDQLPAEQLHVALKRALGGDQPHQEAGDLRIGRLERIHPAPHRIEAPWVLMGVTADGAGAVADHRRLEQVFDQDLAHLKHVTPVPQPLTFDRAEMAIGQGHQHSRAQELFRSGRADPEAVDQGPVAGMVQILKGQTGEIPGQLLRQQPFLSRGEITVGKRQLVQRSEPQPPSRRLGVEAVDGNRVAHGMREAGEGHPPQVRR